ncbi:MAG: hypothetical protein O2985_13300 [Proteobacteria bacterium]|nr:hypothetical protein [Pseudomonadota bacterium]
MALPWRIFAIVQHQPSVETVRHRPAENGCLDEIAKGVSEVEGDH